MEHYKNQCHKNPKIKKWESDEATISIDEYPPNKTKTADSNVKELFY